MPPKSKRIPAPDTTVPLNPEQAVGWVWKQEGSCHIGSSGGLIGQHKIASFDMDDTLVRPKSGKKFPVDAQDWVFLFDCVPKTLQKLSKDGYKIVIFTNQMGIKSGKTVLAHLQKKVKSIAEAACVEMQVYIASDDDQYRKPSIKMWDCLEKHNDGLKIDKAKSFYCGDAAGRKDAKHKDFSDSDLKFGLNVGVPFKTPENLFLNDVTVVQVKGFNPSAIPEQGKLLENRDTDAIEFVAKEMVIFVGSPGAGKSTFWKNYMSKYQRVNRDTLKTKEKCYKAAEEQIVKGNSVIIDNTNPKKEDRKYFIDLAKKHGYRVRCFEFLTPKEICFHNDFQRVANNIRQHLSDKTGSIPIHSWFKYKEELNLEEGFYEINKVNFLARFEGPEDRQAYLKFSKK